MLAARRNDLPADVLAESILRLLDACPDELPSRDAIQVLRDQQRSWLRDSTGRERERVIWCGMALRILTNVSPDCAEVARRRARDLLARRVLGSEP